MKNVDLKELFKQGYLTDPFPAVYFKELVIDGEVLYWLYMTNGTTDYQTSIDEVKWNSFSLESKAKTLIFMQNKIEKEAKS